MMFHRHGCVRLLLFKGGGGGLTGATTSTETENNEQTSAQEGDALNLSGAKVSGSVSVTSSDPQTVEDALATAGDVAGKALDSNTAIASLAITQGAITEEANIQEAQTVNLHAIDALNNIAGDYSQIVANAAPQTAAAEQELLTGNSPIVPQESGVFSDNSQKWYNYVWIAAGLLTIYVIVFKKGKAT